MYVIFGDTENIDFNLKEGQELRVFDFERKKEFIEFIKKKKKEILSVGYFDIDEEELKELSDKIGSIDPEVYQIALAEKSHDSINGQIDEILVKDDRLSKIFVKRLDELTFKKSSERLRKAVSSCEGELSIFVHDDPDLDAIGSAMALEEICKEEGVDFETYYGGSIGHPETEIFLENSDLVMSKVDEESIENVVKNAAKIAFLDFADPSVSNVIPNDVEADIIIDHHQTNKDAKAKEFTEIRTDVGATSTLITKYLLNLDIDIRPILASALLLGIKIDTRDYTKNIHATDYKVLSYLSSIADKDILDVLERTPILSETFTEMGRAIDNREFEGNVMITYCGEIKHSDDISQIADFLLREKDILTVLVCGRKKDKIHLSARSKDLELNVGDAVEKAFTDIGEAGGHPHSAGGEIPFEDRGEEELVDNIKERFLREVFEE